MFEEKIIKRVPGKLCPNPKEKQGYIDDLYSKSKVELVELLERQDKLLSNKSFLSKLLDKGERIKAFRERIYEILLEKDQIDGTSGLLSALSLSKSNVNEEIEWTSKLTSALCDNSSGNTSDEETDPLKILASHIGAGRYKKTKHRQLKELEGLQKSVDGNNTSTVLCISEEDTSRAKKLDACDMPSLKEDPACSSEINSCAGTYAKNWCSKVDRSQEHKTIPFKPHCTTKSGVHPGLFVPKHQGAHWEVTAATPPPPVHGAVKLITLQESLQLQHIQAAKLKDIQAKHATEKLASNSHVKVGLPDISRNEYRDRQQEYDSSSSSDAEENDIQSDDDDKRDTIVYTYTE